HPIVDHPIARPLDAITRSSIADRRCRLHRRGDLLDSEHFDDVADLDVTEAIEADAALRAGLDLADVVLEAAETGDLALPDRRAVADAAGLRVAASRDATVRHEAAGDRAGLRRLEDRLYPGRAEARLLERRLEKADHGFLNLVGDVVDDRVLADVHFLAFR